MVDPERLGELGADLVAGDPFDHGVGAFTSRHHQPYPRADLESGVGDGHEAAFRNVDDPRLDSVGAKLAHLGLKLDRKAVDAAAGVPLILGDSRADRSEVRLHGGYADRAKDMPIRPSLTHRTWAETTPRSRI